MSEIEIRAKNMPNLTEEQMPTFINSLMEGVNTFYPGVVLGIIRYELGIIRENVHHMYKKWFGQYVADGHMDRKIMLTKKPHNFYSWDEL